MKNIFFNLAQYMSDADIRLHGMRSYRNSIVHKFQGRAPKVVLEKEKDMKGRKLRVSICCSLIVLFNLL